LPNSNENKIALWINRGIFDRRKKLEWFSTPKLKKADLL
jgi:hypothetical protein